MVTAMETEAERFNAALGRQLRAEIAAGKSNIAGMAREIDVARSTLDHYVNGVRPIPASAVYDICAVLGVSVADVVRRAEERFRADQPPVDELTARRERRDVGGTGKARKVASDADERDRGGDDGQG